MQYILILASIFLAFATSCKSRRSSDGGSSAPTPTLTAPACSASLALFDVPNPQDNVSKDDLEKLNLNFSVQTVVDNGVSNVMLSIIPTADAQGRTAEFPRVTICNQAGKCMPEFKFPYWTGIVALPANMIGTLSFKAKACTYIRKQDSASGKMFITGRQCGTKQFASSPATISRPTPNATNATNLVSKDQVRDAILGLGTYLLPFAQNYISFVGNKDLTDPSEQVLYKIANTITNDPDQVGSYLASPLYDQFKSDMSSGSNGMGLADGTTNPCTKTPPPPPPEPVVTPVPVLANDQNGNLLGATTVTQTVTETSTLVQSVVTTVTDTLTVTNTILPSAFSGAQALTGYKLRVLDALSNIQGCMVQTGNINIGFTRCGDTDKFRWNLIPIASMAAAFQIQTFKNPSGATSQLCLTQSSGTSQANVSLILTPCDATNNQQIFRFSGSTLTTIPQTGNGPSSSPYNLLGYTGSTTSANCIDLTTKSFALDATGVWTPSTTPQACTTSYSIDPINEHLSNMEQYLDILGIHSKDPNKAAIPTYLVFGGVTLAIIGGVVGGYVLYDRSKKTEIKTLLENLLLDHQRVTALSQLKIELKKTLDNLKAAHTPMSAEEIQQYKLTLDGYIEEIEKNKVGLNPAGKEQFEFHETEIRGVVEDLGVLANNPNGDYSNLKGKITSSRFAQYDYITDYMKSQKTEISDLKTKVGKTHAATGVAAGISVVIGAAAAVAGGIWWGAEYSLSASDPLHAFANALTKADQQFLLLKAVQNQ